MTFTYDKNMKRKGLIRPPGTGAARYWIVLVFFCLLPLFLAAEFQTHTVKKDDTLYNISKRYGITVEQLKELNGLTSNNISLNQVLKIKEIKETSKPAAQTEPVKPAPPAEVEKPAPVVNTPPVETPSSNAPKPLTEEYFYTVKPKDNLYRIALNHYTTQEMLVKWNGFESVGHSIHPGDRIIVKDPSGTTPVVTEMPPVQNGETEIKASAQGDTTVVQKIYVVQKKDTLYSISKANGMTVDELKALNNLSSNDISVGQQLILAGTPLSGNPKSWTPPLTEAEVEKADKIRSDLAMPTNGTVTSEYGLRNGRPHKGIDIANKTGTPIYAALDGVVVFSGVQGGYGNVIVLEHPDFVMTVYGHNERNLVKVDDHVSKGQLIAYVGATGNSTGPHLHFEYRIKGKAINPRKVLNFN
jgi:murein DD-endopeptidase MepM/ murein hydrolase activator NlpD